MCVVLSEDRAHVLLLRREVFVLWDLPGGGVERNEDPADAAVRETREESGYQIAIERFVGTYRCQSVYGRGDQLTYVFRARVIGGTPKHIGLETTGLRWFPVNALPRGVEPLQRQMIADALADLPAPVERRIEFPRWKLYPARVIFFVMRVRNITARRLLRWLRDQKSNEEANE
jgi:ADP-ribose pyrophosphatase YjhB (NUDIX family)